MRYDIVMVTYNSTKWLSGCVSALAAAAYDLGRLHLIFSDNGSTDGTLDQLDDLVEHNPGFGAITLLRNGKNLGFGTGCNRGAAAGDAPLLLFLNLDTEIDPALFSRIDEGEAAHPKAGGFECRQLPWETGHHIDPVTMETSWASGAALVVRRSVFAQIGGFDEHLFMYCEDVDLSWRIRAAGYPLYYLPHAVVTHYSYEHGQPKLGEYAGSFLGNLLLRYKFGNLRTIWQGHLMYLGAVRHPMHFDGVRRVLVKNYLRHFLQLWPFLFWRFSHREEFAAHTARFEGGFSADRGLAAYLPLPKDPPLISVILRTCGRPETLRRTLQSLRHQTYPNFELIVTEDGAPTAQAMIEQEFSDLPIRYLNDGARHGRAANGNRGLAAAKGIFCNFLDDDDFFYPDHLELMAGLLCAHPEADLVLGSAMAMFVTKDGAITRLEPMVFDRIDRFTMCQNCRIPIQTVLFRRSLFAQYGGLIEHLDAHEDWGMWLHYLEHARRITPHRPDLRRMTSIFVQPADQVQAEQRMAVYRENDRAFFEDDSFRFSMTLADLRRYYDDMIADLRCLEERGELHEFLERQSRRKNTGSNS